jgi:hypothetical protein
MKLNRVWIFWLLPVFAAMFTIVLLLQSRAAGVQDFTGPVHLPVDWSDRHLIYSGPSAGPNAWQAMHDPRYLRHLSMYGDHARFHQEHEFPDGWRDRFGGGPTGRRDASPLKRDWQFSLGVDATTGNVSGGFSYPAKFTFDVNAMPSCTNDYVVFPTGLTGVTGGQASIVAINELYSGSAGACGTGQPSVMWAYNTNLTGDTDGVIYSSPALSLDGSKVVFVETPSDSDGAAILKILKWVSGQGTVSAAMVPTPITTGNAWSTCPTTGTSCLFSLTFSGGAPASISSPFYNYSNDTLYIGDDSGILHKFSGVFFGTPAEVTSGGWPFTIASGTPLTGPVFDSVSGNVFVADLNTGLHYVRDTGSTVGACASGSPPCIGTPTLTVSDGDIGVIDPPVVDATSQRVFVFSGSDPGGNAAVIQASTALAGSVDTTLQGAANYAHIGAFDKNYHSGAYTSAFVYACGTLQTTLFRIGFNSSGVMNSSKATGSVNLDPEFESPACSPMTEILNGANDFIFFGVPFSGGASGCSEDFGCLLGLNLTGLSWPPSVSAFSSLPVPNGPGGIVVDNVGNGGQESSIYFGPQTNNCTTPAGSGCAVKATQSGLN